MGSLGGRDAHWREERRSTAETPSSLEGAIAWEIGHDLALIGGPAHDPPLPPAAVESSHAEDTTYWRERFLEVHAVRGLLLLLRDFGIADRYLLQAMPGLSPRTLRRWRSDRDRSSPSAERRDQLDDVRAVIGFLLADGTYDREAIVAWLTTRQETLDLRRPIVVLGESKFEEVIAAAQRGLSPTRKAAVDSDQADAPYELDEQRHPKSGSVH